MTTFSEQFNKRRTANVASIKKAFGVDVPDVSDTSSRYRTIREGSANITIFTIGYERRDGEGLMSLLRDAGVDILADIREKPMSRVADFRASALQQFCENAGIAYQGWPGLGSTESQRDNLKQTGDFAKFAGNFRTYMLKRGKSDLDELAAIAKRKSVALLCYERQHEECHRSIVADLLADRLEASIVAL
jgi:uncharacterized protein (DUF488 family)